MLPALAGWCRFVGTIFSLIAGWCRGGRIVNHLAAGIEKPENDIVFVGYQAAVEIRGTSVRK